MRKPFWYNLIKQWKESGMGQYGVSFPFLVGAVSRHRGELVTKESIEALYQEIIHKPVEGYYCEVRWCGNIDEPVISVEKSSCIKQKSIQAQYKNSENQPSLAFTTDLMSMFNLDCSTKEECLEILISRSFENTRKGMFSKNNCVFGDFTVREIEFIENVTSSTRNK